MIIKSLKCKGAVEIVLQGKLNFEAVHDLGPKIKGEIMEHSSMVYGFNLQKLDFIDSSGLSFLLRLNDELLADKKKVYFFGANQGVQNIIKISRLEKYMTLIDPFIFYNQHPPVE